MVTNGSTGMTGGGWFIGPDRPGSEEELPSLIFRELEGSEQREGLPGPEGVDESGGRLEEPMAAGPQCRGGSAWTTSGIGT
ncbi:hypothetical protein Nepgr_031320 [Nepenthes gracilis]|uniref:Uncharacterized protein n=1 Tax=Nepenthes gracilis TaxID=150966 RepID=A0AAD3TIL5_NEPGR|nr:hypothetical protein Nepgr_031320 [Nepenthes gracilis]